MSKNKKEALAAPDHLGYGIQNPTRATAFGEDIPAMSSYQTDNETMPWYNNTDRAIHPGQPVLHKVGNRHEHLISKDVIYPGERGTLERNWTSRFSMENADMEIPAGVPIFAEFIDEGEIGVTAVDDGSDPIGISVLFPIGTNEKPPIGAGGIVLASGPGQAWVDVQHFLF